MFAPFGSGKLLKTNPPKLVLVPASAASISVVSDTVVVRPTPRLPKPIVTLPIAAEMPLGGGGN